MRNEQIEAGSARDWLRSARSDLTLAGMKKTRTVLYAHLCFHAQQAAEKAIKAVLIALGVRFPRTHDLAYLLDLLPPDVHIPPSLIDLPTLNRYAIQQRYPGEVVPVTRKHRRRAEMLAGDAVAWAASCITQSRP